MIAQQLFDFTCDLQCWSLDDEHTTVLRRFPITVEAFDRADAISGLQQVAGDTVCELGSDLLDWPMQRTEVMSYRDREDRDAHSPQDWLRQRGR